MRGKVVVIAVVLVFAFAVPTAAVTGSEDDAGAVTMAPHSGPNGEYASVTGGEIEVDFDGLNDEAVTTAHDVFTVTLTANCAARVWVEVEDVAVYRGDDPSEGMGSENEAVVLQPGETVAVGFQIDTTGTVPDPDAMTVHATETGSCGTATPSPTPTDTGTAPHTPSGTPNLSSSLSVSNGSDPFERVLTVRVSNDGTATGTYDVEPTVDGTVVASRTVILRPGEVRELTFVHRFDRSGTYRVSVGGRSMLVSVAAPSEPGPEFRVTALEPAETTVRAGSSVDVVATVENVGDVEGTYTAVLTDGGTVVGEQTVTVPPGETRTVTFGLAFDEPGVHDLAVGEQRATVTVEATESAIRVVEAAVSDRQLNPGNATTITATVENSGETDGEMALDVRVAGVVVETVTVAVPAGETRTIGVERTFGTPGVYAVAIGGVGAGDVTVRAGDTTANRLLTSRVGVTMAVPVLLGLLLATWRRRLVRAVWQRL